MVVFTIPVIPELRTGQPEPGLQGLERGCRKEGEKEGGRGKAGDEGGVRERRGRDMVGRLLFAARSIVRELLRAACRSPPSKTLTSTMLAQWCLMNVCY